jgi:G3E family GTPase
VGCSLAASLVRLKKDIKRNIDPDYLFIEPSEMVVTQELRNVAAQGQRDIGYAVGPLVTLLDGPDFGFHWKERRQLLLGQISGADLVAISRADLIGDKETNVIYQALDGYATGPFLLSIRSGTGLDNVMSALSNHSHR